MKQSAAGVLALALSCSVFAKTPPPAQPFPSRTWPASMTKVPTAGLTLGNLRIRFEQTTLDDVKAAASAGQTAHSGDAGASKYWLCYTLSQRQHSTRIWIVSDGEMGGANHTITSATVVSLKAARPTEDCPALPEKLAPASLDVPVWIGSAEAAVQQALGTPSHREGAWRSFDFEGKVPGRCDGGFDLSNWLLIKSVAGSVDSIHVGQVSSC